MSDIHKHQFDNGLTVLCEPIPGVQSAGLTLLLPAGAAAEPDDRQAVAPILHEQIFRGAGDLDARAHSDALDHLGVHRSASVQTYHLRLGATMLGDRLDAALPLLLDMVRRPRLEEATFPPARDLAVQAIDGLDDEPQEKAMVELKAAHLPSPFGRSGYGRREDLEAATVDDVRQFHRDRFVPEGAILALAGNVDFDALKPRLEQLLGDWSGAAPLPETSTDAPRGYRHIQAPTTQQHIGVAYPAIPEHHDDAMVQKVAVAVLSGGMSGRLFTEVRERRGLCYAVHASYGSLREEGAVFAYAGTTAERAPQTLEVLTGELQRLSEGVETDEFDRAIVGLKTRVVMQGESTSARAGALAYDQFMLGRPRSLDEIADEVDRVDLDRLNRFVADHRPPQFTTLNIGPEPLQ